MGEIFSREIPKNALEWTGERLTDGAEAQVELEHLHRYFFARELVRGKDVLDIAAGEGYGSALLAQTARFVVGIDNAIDAITHAKKEYHRHNLKFVLGDANNLPVADASIDIVVSFETIEHILDHDNFLTEVRRVLNHDGMLLISTPERDTYSPADTAANPFHLNELSRNEFSILLKRHFPHVTLVGQRPVLGSAIFPEDLTSIGSLRTFEQRGSQRFEATAGLPRAVYILALASNIKLSAAPGSLYIHTSSVGAAIGAALQAEIGRFSAAAEADRSRISILERDLQSASADLALLRDSFRDAVAERERAESREADLSRNLVEGHAALEASQLHAAELEVSLDEGRARLSAMEASLDDAKQRLATTQSYGDNVERELGNAVAALAEAGEYARHLERELTAQQVRAEQIINAISASRSWQATKPFRRLSASSPSVQRWLRRIGDALPWVHRQKHLVSERSESIAQGLSEHLHESPSSTTANFQSEATEDHIKALFTEKLSAELDHFLAGDKRIIFRPIGLPTVSVLIVVWNKAHLTLRCLSALQAEQDVALEIVIVDNASSDHTEKLLKRVDGAKIFRNSTNVGFLLATNDAAKAAVGENLLLLNNDAFVRPGTLSAALQALGAEPDTGAVGGRLILPSGLIQEAGSIIWNDGSTFGYGRGLAPERGEVMFRRQASYCSGAFLLTPRRIWERLAGFDEAFAPAYYEDADYCIRLQEQGLKIVYEPAAVVDHYELGSQAKAGDATEATLRNRSYFRDRHRAVLDQYLPPNIQNPLHARDHMAARRTRLLFIDDLLPLQANGSGMPRARAMILAAIKAGWSVTFYAMHDPSVDWQQVWRQLPAGLEVIADRGPAELGNFLRERAGSYSSILVSRPHNIPLFWNAIGGQSDVLGHARVIYDAEAVYAARRITQHLAEGIELHKEGAEALIAQEVQSSTAGVRAVTCVSEEDRALFRRFVPPNVPVHRVGHSIDIAVDTPPHSARCGFLFVGRLLEQDAPNWQGLSWFLRECWPRIRQRLPDVQLSVVGKLHPVHTNLLVPGVRLLGSVDELLSNYNAARVFVAPLQFAAGVPIKIIEATAAGLPTACTTLMARQLNWPVGEALAAADVPAELAELAVALHEDGDAWRSMVYRAQTYLHRDFDQGAFEESMKAALCE